MKKKILYYIHGSYVNGGAFLSAFEILKRLSEDNRFEVHVFIIKGANPEVKETIETLGLNCQATSAWNFMIFGRSLIGWLSGSILKMCFHVVMDIIASLINVYKFSCLVEKFDPDIIHFNSSVLLPLTFFTHKKNRKFVVHCREGIRPYYFTNIRYKIMNYLVSKVDKLICISPTEKNQFDLINRDEEKTIVVPNPIDNQIISNIASVYSINKDFTKIAIFGGYTPAKGAIEFLSSLKKIYSPFQVLFCGPEKGPSEYQKKVDKLILELEKKDNCVFTFCGLIKKPLSVISASDLVVVPHIMPHFSRVIIESWSLKKPVICFSDTFTDILDKQSYGALILSNKTIDNLALKIEELMKDPELAKAKALKGKNYWEKNHKPKNVTNMVLDIYNDLKSEGGSADE